MFPALMIASVLLPPARSMPTPAMMLAPVSLRISPATVTSLPMAMPPASAWSAPALVMPPP